MAIGPVQLLLDGFEHPDFRGEVLEELTRLKESDTVRVIDAVVVHRTADGELKTLKRSDLNPDDAAEFGALVGALVGLGAGGLEGAEAGAQAGAEALPASAPHAYESVETAESEWDVLEEIPPDTAAALVLLEHRWAIPVREALHRANGFVLADGFIHAEDLVAIGMLAAEDAAVTAN